VENLRAWAEADCVHPEFCVFQMRALLREAADTIEQLQTVRAALVTPELTDIHLTFGHPEFGIECTAVFDHQAFETVTNQADGATAIVNAVAAVRVLVEAQQRD
jgi:hypothetical protein